MARKKVVGIFLVIGFVGSLVVIFLLSSCSGSSARPQASLPAPSDICEGDECITISSPDEEGFVTITGSAGSVPNSSIVLIDVSQASAHFLHQIWDLICPSAHAQATCRSELSQCSSFEDDFESQCQLTADVDGSFVIRLKIASSRRVVISYLDPNNSCEEVEVVNGNISDLAVAGMYPLTIEGMAMTHDGDNAVLVFGQNASDESRLVKLDVEGFRLSESHEIGMDGQPVFGLHLGTDVAERVFLFTDEEAAIAEIAGGELTLFATLEDVSGTAENLVAQQGILQENFTYAVSLADYPSCSSAADTFLFPFLGDTVDRVLFARTLDSSSAFDQGNPLAILDHVTNDLGDLPEVRPIQYSLTPFANEFTELVGASFESAVDIVATENGERAFLLANMTISGGTRHYLFEVPLDSVFCESSVFGRDEAEAEGTDLVVIPLPQDLSSPGNLLATRMFVGSDDHDVILVPDSGENTITVVDVDTSDVYTNAVDPLEDAGLVGVRGIVAVSSGLMAVGSRPFLLELDVQSVSGSPFLIQQENSEVVGISPLSIQLINGDLIILSQGRAGDGLSSVRVIGLE